MDAEETEMFNAADDPGRRPPPPRHGEPQPYPGGPHPGGPHPGGPHPGDPYQGDPYQGDPQAYPGPRYPAGPSYQGGGYAPPSYPAPPAGPAQQPQNHSPAFPPGPASRRPGDKGFFGSLFDLNFDHMVTTRLIRVVYVLAILVFSLISVFVFLVGLWSLQFSWGKYVGVFLVPAAPLLWLLELVTVRLALEFVINQFKITEHLKAIREQREPR